MIPALKIESVTKSFAGKDTPAVKDASLELKDGCTLGLIGESGCGKTTLLRIIAGFEVPESGTVSVAGKEVVSDKTLVAPGKRNIGMIFQDFALFPHLSVVENILFGVTEKSKPERNEIARRMLELTNLEGLEDRKPGALSGGQQQRLALARSMATSPKLLLLDEPFSNLDITLRQHMREQVSQLLNATKTSAVLVTHDIEDAVFLCDKMAVMRDGVIMQMGAFDDIYHRPLNEYIARLSGEVIDLTPMLKPQSPEVKILIRPEKIRLQGSTPRLRVRVIAGRFTGKSNAYKMECGQHKFTFSTSERLETGSEMDLFFEDHDTFQFEQ